MDAAADGDSAVEEGRDNTDRPDSCRTKRKEAKMKVVITSQGKEISDAVDPRFGRARYFILADTESGEFQTHDNTQNLNAMQGAGVQSAKNVADLGAEAVITGNVGPKAFATLKAGGIRIYLAPEATAEEAMKMFNEGKLESADDANVEGHWM